jgi:arginyl-tRNA synthetase
MLQKSDGGYGYDSTDMAALKYRLFELKADRIIIITDFTQSDHFKMIYGAGRDIGWVSNEQKLEHIGFGTVQGEDGKRFKTRSGDTVRLVDLLDEAVTRMATTLRERIQQQQQNQQNQSEGAAAATTTTTPMSDEEITQVAEAIGYGAVKYFDLRRNPTSNYKFSYDQMLSTVGDTAVYLIYARVRLDSIISKAATEHNINIDDLLRDIATNPSLVTITEDAERNLVFQLQQFADTMIVTLNDLYPFHICEYVYKLATAASDFVTQCRVLDPTNKDVMQSRLLLCYATSSAMVQCFNLLGIRHVKRI